MRNANQSICTLMAAAVLALAATPLAGQTVTISPTSATVRGGATRTFTATVTVLANKTVTWSVDGVVGGDVRLGTVNTSGLYTAPPFPPTPNTVKVRATSVATPTLFAEATVTLQNPTPSVTTVTPGMVNVGTFTIQVAGTGFAAGARVLIGSTIIPTTYVSETQLTATTTDNNARDTTVSVQNPEPGLVTSNQKTFKIMPPVSVNATPDTATVRIGSTKQFFASVSNSTSQAVEWYVNAIKGGNASIGTITDAGVFTPPAVLPPYRPDSWGTTAAGGPTVTVRAVATLSPKASDQSIVTLQNALPVLTSLAPTALVVGNQVQLTVNGTGFAPGSSLMLGSNAMAISSFAPNRIVGAATAKAGVGGVVTVSVRNPDPGGAVSNALIVPVGPATQQMTAQAAARFLERATWGPTPDSIAHLQQVGIPAFLQEQFAAPISDLPEPIAESTSPATAQRIFYINAMNGPDQLRQRVGFALSQIMVVSGVKTNSSQQLVPYMRMMNRQAFGNYFSLIKDVTLNPTMGRFLDMVNNRKLTNGVEPNENYARELLQLFTLGLVQLNMDGSSKLDPLLNTPLPSYTEADVKEFAKVFTGWTYPTQPGEMPRFPNPSYYAGPMIAFDEQHDKTTKRLLLGEIVPDNRTAAEEIDMVVNNIRNHPNVPPFIALRLIQRLVMGNPSAAYIQRVATVFQNSGGDLRLTTQAILTDPEADNAQTFQGKLREPVLFILSFLRSLNATVAIDHTLNTYAAGMGQDLWFAGSVFNYFSPFFRANGQVAPEFQLNTPSVALNRVNFIYRASRNNIGSVAIDLGELERLSADPNALLEALNQALLHGGLTPAMRTSILTAINATTDVRTRARNAAYLVGSSSQFQVEP